MLFNSNRNFFASNGIDVGTKAFICRRGKNGITIKWNGVLTILIYS